MLSITAISSIVDDNTDITKEEIKKTILEEDINMILYPSLGFIGINLDIENNGEKK